MPAILVGCVCPLYDNPVENSPCAVLPSEQNSDIQVRRKEPSSNTGIREGYAQPDRGSRESRIG